MKALLKEIKLPIEEPLRIPVYVLGINTLRCTKSGKHYYYVHVTDGERTEKLRMYDSRIHMAKEKFNKCSVYITVKRKETPYISKIELAEEIDASEFGEAVKSEPASESRPELSSLDDHKDSFFCFPALVKDIGPLKTSKNNKPYYTITVTDGNTDASFYSWDDNAEEAKEKYLNEIVYITAKIDDFPKVTQIQKCDDYPCTDFIKTAPVSSETMYDEITGLFKDMTSTMAPVAMKIYEDNKEKLLRWAGALKLHHAVYGGLLYHVYRMLKAAEQICGIYPKLNRELLLIGTALHDIGKLKELETNEFGISEFTPEGNLSGHTLCGIEMLNNAVTEMEEAPDPEEYKQVKHMIASHHGLLEHGAIVVPATAEAMVLNNLDLIDSRMYMFEEALTGIEPGTVSGSIWALDGAHIYKPATTG